ncbi:PST family polysaccharide transporter [Pontibacter mucosus]|uniref:PST family polysaccharide transporter n=2 Tax=Pontibacter mucosus TaxID=1649266 RepID=A0A2T5YDY1_9BACT|nr:PST family polysaccharide transporter [Pontibacter mucosus]
MFYFTVLTDYGFSLSATKDISIYRHDVGHLSRIYSEVMTTKAVLCILSLCIITVALLLTPKYQVYSLVTCLSFTIVLGQLLLPTWFFQGVEKMKYITYINILSRTLYAILIFVFINKADDYIYINLINGGSAIVGGVIGLIIVYKKFQISFSLPNFQQIKNQLVGSWSVFISNVTVTVANNTNILILGLFATPLQLGYYSIAEKVFLIFRSFAGILHQVVYPRVCILAQASFSTLAIFLRKIVIVVLATFLPLSLLIFLLSDYIVFLITGEYLGEASFILKIISLGPFMAALNIPVSQTMLAYHLTRNYAMIMSVGAVANIILNFTLASYFKAVGTAYSILITETLITSMLFIAVYKYYPQYFFLKKNSPHGELEIKK